MSVDDILDKFRRYKKIEDNGVREAFNQIMMFIFSLESGSKDRDLFVLAKILDYENFTKLIDFYDGETLHIPTKEQRDELINVSMCYYLHEILGYDWKKTYSVTEKVTGVSIRESERTMSSRVKRIKQKMNSHLTDLIDKIKKDEFEETYER